MGACVSVDSVSMSICVFFFLKKGGNLSSKANQPFALDLFPLAFQLHTPHSSILSSTVTVDVAAITLYRFNCNDRTTFLAYVRHLLFIWF